MSDIIGYEILVLWQHQLSRVVHSLNFSAHQNSISVSIQTAVKVKLVFAQLLTFYLDGSDIV